MSIYSSNPIRDTRSADTPVESSLSASPLSGIVDSGSLIEEGLRDGLFTSNRGSTGSSGSRLADQPIVPGSSVDQYLPDLQIEGLSAATKANWLAGRVAQGGSLLRSAVSGSSHDQNDPFLEYERDDPLSPSIDTASENVGDEMTQTEASDAMEYYPAANTDLESRIETLLDSTRAGSDSGTVGLLNNLSWPRLVDAVASALSELELDSAASSGPNPTASQGGHGIGTAGGEDLSGEEFGEELGEESGEESSGEESSTEELSDEELSDEELSDEELSDEESSANDGEQPTISNGDSVESPAVPNYPWPTALGDNRWTQQEYHQLLAEKFDYVNDLTALQEAANLGVPVVVVVGSPAARETQKLLEGPLASMDNAVLLYIDKNTVDPDSEVGRFAQSQVGADNYVWTGIFPVQAHTDGTLTFGQRRTSFSGGRDEIASIYHQQIGYSQRATLHLPQAERAEDSTQPLVQPTESADENQQCQPVLQTAQPDNSVTTGDATDSNSAVNSNSEAGNEQSSQSVTNDQSNNSDSNPSTSEGTEGPTEESPDNGAENTQGRTIEVSSISAYYDALNTLPEGTQILLKIGAEWCGPCRNLENDLSADPALIEQIHDNATFVKVDIGDGEKLPDEWGQISTIPTMIFGSVETTSSGTRVFVPAYEENGTPFRIVGADAVDSGELRSMLDRLDNDVR